MKGAESHDGREHELLRRALERPENEESRSAASELLGMYRERVYVWCYRYVRDHDRAMDLAQDVLLNGYQHLDSFAGRSHFGSWLFAIARNRCISEMRRVSLTYDPEVDPDEIMVGDNDPAHELERAEDEESLLTLIREHLTQREQDAIWLRCIDRMPLEAITRILGIQEKSGARGILQQARRKLKAALETRSG